MQNIYHAVSEGFLFQSWIMDLLIIESDGY